MTTTTTGEVVPKAPKRRIRLGALGPLIALAGLMVLGAALNDHFLTFTNMANIVARASFIGIIAIGATFVITSGGIVRFIPPSSGAVCTWTIRSLYPGWCVSAESTWFCIVRTIPLTKPVRLPMPGVASIRCQLSRRPPTFDDGR